MITHIFFIVHPVYEPERYSSILTLTKTHNITNYTIVSKFWGCDITESMKKTLVKSDFSMKFHGRTMDTKPLSNGEISLFLNHIECLNIIRSTYKEGLFLILESDVLFKDHMFETLDKIIDISREVDFDIINIGEGNGIDKPVSKPIFPTVNSVNLYKEKRNRCAEGILWKYSGAINFLNYHESSYDIDGPIDTKMDVYSEFMGKFNIYWAHPALVYQGSVRHIFKSHLR